MISVNQGMQTSVPEKAEGGTMMFLTKGGPLNEGQKYLTWVDTMENTIMFVFVKPLSYVNCYLKSVKYG